MKKLSLLLAFIPAVAFAGQPNHPGAVSKTSYKTALAAAKSEAARRFDANKPTREFYGKLVPSELTARKSGTTASGLRYRVEFAGVAGGGGGVGTNVTVKQLKSGAWKPVKASGRSIETVGL